MRLIYTELVPSDEMLGKKIACTRCKEPTHEDYVYEGVCFSCLYLEAAKDQPPYASINDEKLTM